MNRDDAIVIVGMIVHSWPGPAWETARLEAYVVALEPMDAAVTTRAVALAVRELRYRPSIAELREFVRIERALSEPEEARYVLPDKPVKPQWVVRWDRARKAGDMRLFPEQLAGLDSLARQSPEDYRAYAPTNRPMHDSAVWVQPSEFLDEA